MANDDDLIKQHGEDFSGSNGEDDFMLPDDPTDEVGDGGHEGNDIDLGLGEDDEVDLTFDDDNGDNSPEDQTSDDASGEHEEADQYEEDGDQPQHTMGWKTYTGLALSVVLVAGGLTYFVMPGATPTGAPSNQSIETAREIIRQRAGEGIEQANRQQQAVQAPSAKQGGVVEVQAFPSPDANQPSQVSPPNEYGDQGGFGGSNDNQMPGMSSPDSFNNGSQAIIPDPTDRVNEDVSSMPRNFRLNDMREFQVISDLANNNRQKIRKLEGGKASNSSELGRLERRIIGLEEKLDLLLDQGAKNAQATGMASTQELKAEKSGKAAPSIKKDVAKPNQKVQVSGEPVAYSAKVPKTPAEIKALQRQLAIYGYRPGKVDGVMGGNTRDAIKRIQREHGLPETGWLSGETLLAMVKPNHYSGSYSAPKEVKFADHPRDEKKHKATWYVRGVTPNKAVVYRLDGMSYAVAVGTEIPGMGQVTRLDPANHEVRTAHGTINKREVR